MVYTSTFPLYFLPIFYSSLQLSTNLFSTSLQPSTFNFHLIFRLTPFAFSIFAGFISFFFTKQTLNDMQKNFHTACFKWYSINRTRNLKVNQIIHWNSLTITLSHKVRFVANMTSLNLVKKQNCQDINTEGDYRISFLISHKKSFLSNS